LLPRYRPASRAACPVPPCDQPILIGVSQALTGDKSDPGTGIEHGYQVWVKEVNDAGGLLGRTVALKEYDNQSLADTAVSQIERLVTVDKVNLLMGPFSSALTIPTSSRRREVQDGLRRRGRGRTRRIRSAVPLHLLRPAGRG